MPRKVTSKKSSKPHTVLSDGIPLKSWCALLALGLTEHQAYRAWQIVEGVGHQRIARALKHTIVGVLAHPCNVGKRRTDG